MTSPAHSAGEDNRTRAVPLPELLLHLGEPLLDDLVVGRELGGFLISGDGLLEIALGFIGAATGIEGAGKVRLQGDGPVEVGDGAVVVLLFLMDEAAIEIAVDVVRLQLDRLVIVGEGGVMVALVIERIGAVEVGDGKRIVVGLALVNQLGAAVDDVLRRVAVAVVDGVGCCRDSEGDEASEGQGKRCDAHEVRFLCRDGVIHTHGLIGGLRA